MRRGGEAVLQQHRQEQGQREGDGDDRHGHERGKRMLHDPAQGAHQRLGVPREPGFEGARHATLPRPRRTIPPSRGRPRGRTRRRRFGRHPSFAKDDAARPESLDQVHIVRRDHHGHADVVEALEQLHDLEREIRIQVAGGLIGDQQRRLGDDRPRDADALLLAGRELERAGIFSLPSRPTWSSAARTRLSISRLGTPAMISGSATLSRDGSVVQQLVILEHHADLAAELGNPARS